MIDEKDIRKAATLTHNPALDAVAKHKKPENRHVELGREEWWNDLKIYDNFKTKLL